MSTTRKIVWTDTATDGAYLQLRYTEARAGRTRIRKWRIYRDGVQSDYAASPADMQANWQRALDGLTRDTATGRWVTAGPRVCPDICPACGFDLAGHGHPPTHRSDPIGTPCAFTWTAR